MKEVDQASVFSFAEIALAASIRSGAKFTTKDLAELAMSMVRDCNQLIDQEEATEKKLRDAYRVAQANDAKQPDTAPKDPVPGYRRRSTKKGA
jgi:hypothetical protein